MLETLTAGLGVQTPPEAGALEVSGIRHDSRRVEAGDLFVAWRGERADGHRFAADAVRRGAVAVLAERPLEGLDAPILLAPSTRRLLAPLAARLFAHPDRELRAVAITGTNGKSTVCQLVAAALDRAGYPCGRIGTLGSTFGHLQLFSQHTTPEGDDLYRSLREMRRAGAAAVALEASSHALEQGRLDGARFEVAVFTNLSRDHLDYHGDLESYFASKRRLFEQLRDGGVAVVNRDDPYGRRLLPLLPEVLTFAAADADVRVLEAELGVRGTRAVVATPRTTIEVESPLVGSFNLSNLLAAIAAGEALALEPEAVVAALRETGPIPGRLEAVCAGQEFPAWIDYAHTEAALRAVLEAVRGLWAGRIVVVFGCGGDRDRGKREPMGRVAVELADLAIVTDDNPRGEAAAAIRSQVLGGARAAGGACEEIADRAEAIRRAVDVARQGGDWAVVVAGKGHENEQVVGERRLPFSDRAELLAALGGSGGSLSGR